MRLFKRKLTEAEAAARYVAGVFDRAATSFYESVRLVKGPFWYRFDEMIDGVPRGDELLSALSVAHR